MPELPEVETVRMGLNRLLLGRVIKNITHDWPKSFPNSENEVKKFALGATVFDVRRRAKVLMIDLDSGYSLVIHLKMTGQLVFVGKNQVNEERVSINKETKTSSLNYQSSILKADSVRFGAGHPNDSLVGRLPDRSTRVIIEFQDGSHLYFNDQRKFGWMKLIPTTLVNWTTTGFALEADARRKRAAEQTVLESTVREQRSGNTAAAQDHSMQDELESLASEWGAKSVLDFMKKVGPEPLEEDFTPGVFIERLQKRKNSNIKAAILDQTVLAGVGNIYADESLWGARIHPAELVKNIDKSRLKKLHSEIIFVLKLSIKKGGSTDRNYVNAEGKKGSYIQFARVFRKEGQPCPRHPNFTIIKIRVAGRGTHICAACQKLETSY